MPCATRDLQKVDRRLEDLRNTVLMQNVPVTVAMVAAVLAYLFFDWESAKTGEFQAAHGSAKGALSQPPSVLGVTARISLYPTNHQAPPAFCYWPLCRVVAGFRAEVVLHAAS